MAKLEQLLLGAGGKLLARLAARRFGPEVGAFAGDALELLAEALGVAPDVDQVEQAAAALPKPELTRIVASVEGRTAELVLAEAKKLEAANEQQRLTNELLLAGDKPANRWLVVWQYLFMAFWGWTIFLAPVANAVLRLVSGSAEAPQLALVDVGVLMTLTSLYLGLHMGGHTVLEMVRNKWGGAFGRKDEAP
ncbi:holin [Microcystis phage Mwe-Yong1]|nr:holin [Microcystis phage Mwe-Yong1]